MAFKPYQSQVSTQVTDSLLSILQADIQDVMCDPEIRKINSPLRKRTQSDFSDLVEPAEKKTVQYQGEQPAPYPEEKSLITKQTYIIQKLEHELSHVSTQLEHYKTAYLQSKNNKQQPTQLQSPTASSYSPAKEQSSRILHAKDDEIRYLREALEKEQAEKQQMSKEMDILRQSKRPNLSEPHSDELLQQLRQVKQSIASLQHSANRQPDPSQTQVQRESVPSAEEKQRLATLTKALEDLQSQRGEYLKTKQKNEVLENQLESYKILAMENEELKESLKRCKEKVTDLTNQNIKLTAAQDLLDKSKAIFGEYSLNIASFDELFSQFKQLQEQNLTLLSQNAKNNPTPATSELQFQTGNQWVFDSSKTCIFHLKTRPPLSPKAMELASVGDSSSMEKLRKKLAETTHRLDKTTEQAKFVTSHFKKLFYNLSGWKVETVDRKQKLYRLTSKFQQNGDHLLIQEVNRKFHLLETDFSKRIGESAKTVMEAGGIPFLLSQLTTDFITSALKQ